MLSAAHLECPVCLEVRDGHIHQCQADHLVCAECDRGLTTRLCPTCREPLHSLAQPNRNRFAERMIARLPAACDHCGAATTRGDKAGHELDCPQRPRACAAAGAGCAWSGLVGAKAAHEAQCVFVIHVAPLRVRVAELEPQNQRLQARVAALEPQVRTLRDENERLRRAAEGGGFRRVRQCVDEGALLGGLGVKPKPKPVVIKKWCEEIKVGTWMSGDGTVVFEPDIFHWVPPREVPGVGIVTLKMRTSSISQAVFDKRSNVLKVRGLVEVPMDKLVRYYDCFASPGAPPRALSATARRPTLAPLLLQTRPRAAFGSRSKTTRSSPR